MPPVENDADSDDDERNADVDVDVDVDDDDSLALLTGDADAAVADFALLLGGRDLAVASKHPGNLMRIVYDATPNAGPLIRDLVRRVSTLVTRVCRLEPSVPASTDGAGGAPANDKNNKNDKKRKRGGKRGAPTAGPVKVRINHLLEALYYVELALQSCNVGHRLVRHVLSSEAPAAHVDVSDEELAAAIERFSSLDAADANSRQSLLLFMLNTLQVKGYRRSGKDCCDRVITEGGHDTHAWRRVSPIEDFVYASTRKEINFAQWMNLTSNPGNAASVAEHLALCHDVQFPPLVVDRHVFAFVNGVYLAATDHFAPYATETVAPDVVACKYFDGPFDDHRGVADWYDIPTPNMQRILDHQDFAPEVCRWMYVLIGRLIYEVNERDGWQVMPFLKGQAATGKSTIVNSVCRVLYESADVGTLSNNVERKFGLSAFADKLLFVAPEIKQDIQLEQAEFQSIVSGECVQVNVKYKTAHTVVWKVPGIMAGNEQPNWRDNSGSFQRRVVVFEFVNRVPRGDTELGAKLGKELPALIKKCNVAYLRAVEECGHDDIWMHLPEYFKETRKQLSEDANSLAAFLRDANIRVDVHAYILYQDFIERYKAFCASNQRTAVTSVQKNDLINNVRCLFPDASVCVKKAHKVWPLPGGRAQQNKFICGIGFDDGVAGGGAGYADHDDPLDAGVRR